MTYRHGATTYLYGATTYPHGVNTNHVHFSI